MFREISTVVVALFAMIKLTMDLVEAITHGETRLMILYIILIPLFLWVLIRSILRIYRARKGDDSTKKSGK